MAESNKQVKSRGYTIAFSIVGSLITILFFAFINFSTGVRFPWFIFPSYAVLWWPILTILIGRRSMKMLSLFGSLITIALLVVLNYLTSWGYPWFLFPSFAILWWPVAMFFGSGNKKIFSVVGSIVMIAFFIITNFVTSPSVIWFYYPVFSVIWWPLSEFFAGPRTIKGYSVLGALIIIAFLTLENHLKSPFCPWVLFTYFPVLMWPTGVMLGRRLGKLTTALIGSFAGIVYYTALNVMVFQGFPWAIFPAYVLLWWPLAIAFAKRGTSLLFSIIGSLLSAALFIAVNLIASPHSIWAIYPVFALAWWPLSIYFFVYRRRGAGLTTNTDS
ncbi:MAG: hypothetical protein ACERKO_10830 [Acetanaerobacterium sp.]